MQDTCGLTYRALEKQLHNENEQMEESKYGRQKCGMSCVPGTIRTAAGVPARCMKLAR